MAAHAQRVGHDRERRVDRAAGNEEAAVDDIEIVEVVRFAVNIESAGFGILAEAHRADLVRYAGKRNALADKQIARKQSLVTLVAVNFAASLLLHELL